MPDQPLRLLVVEQDDDYYGFVHNLLTNTCAAAVERAVSGRDALERTGWDFDAVLFDCRAEPPANLEHLRELRKRHPKLPVIAFNGDDERLAVEAMQAGATEYVPASKVTDLSLRMAVHYAVALRQKDEAVCAARRALRASEQRFRALVENCSDIITALDLHGTILYISPAVHRILGYTPEELIDTDGFDLVHPDDLPRMRDMLSAALRGPGVTLRADHRVRHKSGHYIEMEATGSNHLHDNAVGAIVLNTRDTTQRNRAEQALRQSEHEYRTLFENANDALMIFEPEGETILEVNRTTCEVYGMSRDQLIGSSLRDISRDPERGRAAVAECMRRGQLKGFETVHHRPDGSPIYLLVNGSVIEYGGRRAILTINHNISGRRAAEREIHRLNRALKALSKCNQALLHAAAHQELLHEICHIVVEVGGYRMAWVAVPREDERKSIVPIASAGYVEGYLDLLEVTWADCEGGRMPVAHCVRTGATSVCRDLTTDPRFAALREECVRRGYASLIALPLNLEFGRFGALAIYSGERDAFDSAEVELLRELAGNVSYGIASLSSRARRERAEKKLRESEHRLRSLIETANEGIWTVDTARRTSFVNRKMAEMLGYTPEEMLGRDCIEFVVPERRERGLSAMRGHQHAQIFETAFLRKDGTRMWAMLNRSPLFDADGRETGALAMISDITERRQLQEQLLHAQKLEAVGQLAGGIAHDFNNLLMVIGSYAEIVADSITDAKLRRQVKEIQSAVRRGASLSRQLLAFSRKQVLTPRLLDLNSIVVQFGSVLPRMVGERIRVETRTAHNLWTVKADPVQVEQVLVNLAVNARDAMPQGGKLLLETGNAFLDEEYARQHADVVSGEYAMLAVTDTGEGIAPDVLPRIFDPFFTTKERGKGTGLGLATVYGTVKQSGGFVWVYSEVGRGTVFKVYLPRAQAEATAARPPAASAGDHVGTETVLLVEDEEAVRGAASEYLRLRGYTVLEASNADDALTIAARTNGNLDLVVTDVVMPGMSGSELARRLAKSHPATQVLFVSGYTEATAGQHGLGVGAAFLQKPFSLSALAQKIRELVDAPPAPK